MKKHIGIVSTSLFMHFFAAGMDQRSELKVIRHPVAAHKHVGMGYDFFQSRLYVLVNNGRSEGVAQILRYKKNSNFRNADPLAQKLYAVLTQPNTIGFSIKDFEAPQVSFNSIKSVAFDLAKQGNNENFEFVLPCYTVGTDTSPGEIYSSGFVSRAKQDLPIYHLLPFKAAVTDMNYARVADILATDRELVTHYPLARKFYGVMTNQVDGDDITMGKFRDQSIPDYAVMSTALTLNNRYRKR